MIDRIIENIGKDAQCADENQLFLSTQNITNSPSKAFDCVPVFVNMNDPNVRALCP